MISTFLVQNGKIYNPVVTGAWGSGGTGAGASSVGNLIAAFIRVMVIVGSLGFILYFILGAVHWITAGGDKGKVEEAKNEIVNAVTGLVILLALYAVVTFLNKIFGIDLLNIFWPVPK